MLATRGTKPGAATFDHIAFEDTVSAPRWQYFLTAIIPLVIIAVFVSYLTYSFDDRHRLIRETESALVSISTLQNASIALQKIRGLEQILPFVNRPQSSYTQSPTVLVDAKSNKPAASRNLAINDQINRLREQFSSIVEPLQRGGDFHTQYSTAILTKVFEQSRILFSKPVEAKNLESRFAQYTIIIGQIGESIISEALLSYRELGEVKANFYLLDMYSKKLPKLIESIGRLRGYGSRLVAERLAQDVNKENWLQLLGGVNQSIEDIEHINHILDEIKPSGYPDLSQKLAIIKSMLNQYTITTNRFFNNNYAESAPLDYFDHGTKTISQCQNLHAAIHNILVESIDNTRTTISYMKYGSLSGGCIGILVLLFFTVVSYRSNQDSFKRLRAYNSELINRKEQIKQIIDLIPHMVVVRDLDGKILLQNKAFSRIVGKDCNEEHKQNKRATDHCHCYDQLFSKDKQVIASGKQVIFKQHGYDNTDGVKKVLQTTKIPFDIAGGCTPAVLTVSIDITDTVRIRELQNVSGVGYWEWDLNSNRIHWSEALHGSLGYSPGELDGGLERFMQIIHPVDKPKVIDAFKQAHNNGIKIGLECRCFRKDAKQRYLYVQSEVYQRSDNHTVLIVGTIQDTTAKKHALQLLQQSEEKYRKLVESLREGYFFYSYNTHGELTYASPSVKTVLGYDPKEFLLQATDFLTDKDFNRYFLHSTQRRQLDDRTTPYEIEIKCKDGKIRWLELSEIPVFNPEGSCTGYDGIAHDITGQKQSEKELLISEARLRQLSVHLQDSRERERVAIARDIHDELGGYLAALKMDIALVKKKVSIENSVAVTKLQGMAKLVDTAVQSMRRIITHLRPSILDELGLVEAVEWQLTEFSKRYDISVTIHSGLDDGELKFTNPGAPIAIFRVYQEMLTNVVRHAKAAKVEVSLVIIDGFLNLAVKDDGVGIETDYTQKRGSYGILGMQERMRLLHGEFSLLSKPDYGTTVSIKVPLHASNQACA